jgi:cob(I)alamin adenosyltransferase
VDVPQGVEVQVLSWAPAKSPNAHAFGDFDFHDSINVMLYTGKGDNGTTKTFGCDQARISKSSELPEALGTLDELNSYVGLIKVQSRTGELHLPTGSKGKKKIKYADMLRDVQESLFLIQAEVAGAPKSIGKASVTNVEKIIAAVEAVIPPITKFSIAGGTELSAALDVSRTIARRTERRVVSVHELGLRKLSPNTLAYLNRLSSLLFALARHANFASGVADESPRY